MHYVGITRHKSVYTRIYQHKYSKRQSIGREIHRIGWENFDWWVIEEHVPPNLISGREQYWINFFDCVHPKGYNKTHGGIRCFTFSEETRKRISQANRGKPSPNKGKTASPETRAKLSASRIGAKNHFYGKHHTAESNEKNRQAHLGKPLTEEHKAKIGEAGRGKKASEKTRAILREKSLASWARRKAAKAVAEENLAAANSTPTSLSTLNDAVIF
ncbi:MAG: hypothetical protein IJK81_02750 [Selenomonadaceae bacterium]|nr:hypothetical protein [Selenomonadaceae bacterium]